MSKRTPFGYYRDENDALIAIPEQLTALRQAKSYIDSGCTMRAARNWLVEKTGREITIQGLLKAIKHKSAAATGRPRLNRPKDAPTTPKESRLQALKDTAEFHKRRAKEPVLTATAKKKEKAVKKVVALFDENRETKSNIITDEELNTVPAQIKDDFLSEDANIVFKPNPGPQTDFLAATEKEVLYGGARGGGKSYSLLIDPLRFCEKETHRALILRKTMPELRDIIAQTFRLYPKAFPGAKWKEQEKVWTFLKGARIEFGYAENEQDAMRYQGQAYTWLGVDEIGQYATDRIYTLLKGSLRSVDPTIPTYFRATCNPGGAGMHWLKEAFVDAAPWNTPFRVPIQLPDGTTDYITRRFIPAKLSDNPYLNQTTDYRNMLLSLPEKLKKMWLEGRWDIVEGAAFEEFDPDVHVVQPFNIPEGWVKFRMADWGFSSPFCVLWGAIDYDNTLYIYREFYGKGLTADIFAQRVRELERGEYIQYGVLDSSVWSRRGDIGPPVPEIMRQNGCLWRPSDRSGGSRKNGKMEIHRRLRIIDVPSPVDPTITIQTAKLKIFNTCRNLIRTLPLLPFDATDPEDIDTKAEDHAYDALRYGCMSRPLSPDKLEMYQQIQRNEGYRPANARIGY